MSKSREHPLESLLLLIAQRDPEPWYYQAFAREREDVDTDALLDLLELLYLGGLIEKVDTSPQDGPGMALTPLGRRVVDDEELRLRLRRGEPLRPGHPGDVVRQGLLRRTRPWLTWLLLAVNIAVFFLDQYAGRRLTALGASTARGVVTGEWWRLLTSCFLHANLMHLAFNMLALWSAGGFVERTWGRWRYLVLYLLSGWAGACLGVAVKPAILHHGQLVAMYGLGASGALCGILAAEGVWVFLNRRYLPRAMARGMRSRFLTTVILIVFMSIMPEVSWGAHLGGAIGGAVAGVVLHYQRFGPWPVRWLGLALLVPLPWLSWLHLEHVRATDPLWQRIETQEFLQDHAGEVSHVMQQAQRAFSEDVADLCARIPDRRRPAQVERALEVLQEQTRDLEQLLQSLRKARYASAEARDLAGLAVGYAEARLRAFRDVERRLREGQPVDDDPAFITDYWNAMADRQKRWRAALEAAEASMRPKERR